MKSNIIAIIIAGALIGGVLLLTGASDSAQRLPTLDNVKIIDGKQIIEIVARGGYSPRIIAAKADLPTVIKMKTNGTFDCSLALVIPSLDYQTQLPTTGVIDIDVPPQKSGTTMRGLCAMGMFSF